MLFAVDFLAAKTQFGRKLLVPLLWFVKQEDKDVQSRTTAADTLNLLLEVL